MAAFCIQRSQGITDNLIALLIQIIHEVRGSPVVSRRGLSDRLMIE